MRLGRLQTRLFLWLLASIVLALGSSIVTARLTEPAEPTARPAQVMAHTIAANIDRLWDTPPACDEYIARMRQATGFDLRLRRDIDNLPPVVHRTFKRGGALAFDASEGAFIVVVHDGAVVGAVQFASSAIHEPWWRLGAAMGAALLVLGAMARIVSGRLARPIEQVALTAEQFGAGNLAVRTGLDAGPRRWVAAEVRELARAFDAMAGRIEVVVRDQRELLGAISHEIRSPLGRARVALEIARERIFPGPVPQVAASLAPSEASVAGSLASLDQLEHELLAVDAVLGDLFAVTRAGLSDLRTETVPLLPWVRERIAAEPSPPTIEVVSDEVHGVAIDPALLGRALHNVLENARAHGHPPKVPLAVRVERRYGGSAANGAASSVVRIVVRDHGPGFPPDLLERAFEPFVRGETSRSRGRGSTGLGLALVRRIAEAHGGRAFARNVEEAGRVTGAEVGFEIPEGPSGKDASR
jgi:two-component system OmpR family sensor kinase